MTGLCKYGPERTSLSVRRDGAAELRRADREPVDEAPRPPLTYKPPVLHCMYTECSHLMNYRCVTRYLGVGSHGVAELRRADRKPVGEAAQPLPAARPVQVAVEARRALVLGAAARPHVRWRSAAAAACAAATCATGAAVAAGRGQRHVLLSERRGGWLCVSAVIYIHTDIFRSSDVDNDRAWPAPCGAGTGTAVGDCAPARCSRMPMGCGIAITGTYKRYVCKIVLQKYTPQAYSRPAPCIPWTEHEGQLMRASLACAIRRRTRRVLPRVHLPITTVYI
jgi:hypothetical protein